MVKLSIKDILYIFKSTKITRTFRAMALLLAMYQQAKLTREIGSLTLQQTQIDRKIDRIQTNIKNTQKRYQSLFTQLETRAKNMTNQANSMYSQMSMGGLGGLGGALGGMFGGGIGSFLGGIAGDLVSSLFNKNLATSGITNEKLLKAIEDGTIEGGNKTSFVTKNADGSVTIPEVLRKYMGGQEVIKG